MADKREDLEHKERVKSEKELKAHVKKHGRQLGMSYPWDKNRKLSQ